MLTFNLTLDIAESLTDAQNIYCDLEARVHIQYWNYILNRIGYLVLWGPATPFFEVYALSEIWKFHPA